MGILSKVKAVQPNGTWDSGQYGILYKYEYTMEDGNIINAMHKEQKSFPIGADVEYEITKENDYGKTGKVKKPQEQQNYSGGGKKSGGVDDVLRQKLIVRQSSLKAAVDYYAHCHSSIGGGEITPTKIIELAEEFNDWVFKQ